ncbi:ChbG/HpnK family deacetylase [Bordetella ansorpii]|uniref:ChbG/HpnK family deacetylase n=1 Tax=Bordetella ansorpii TaxID=288768 RepID=UPI00399FAEBA
MCADDFGMNSAVDEGILGLVDMGRVSAVSCLSTGPAFAAHATAARDAGVDLGLHLNLTEPMEGSPGLSLPGLIASAYAGLLDASWIDAAIRCQLDAFELAVRRAPDYVDGHQHVHQLPVVRRRLLAALRERYGHGQPWLRCTVPGAQQGQRPADVFKARVIGALGARALRRQAREGGWGQNNGLLGVYGLSGGAAAYSQRLYAWLRAARDGDLLMCHPAAPSASYPDGLSAQRAAEYEVLSRPALSTWLEVNRVYVSRFGALRRHGARESGMVHAAS